MSVQLADYLSLERLRCSVGRDTERVVFRAALEAEEMPFHLLHIFGPGGIGKTTLLRMFATMATEAGVSCFRLDGRNMDASPSSFIAALQRAMGLDAAQAPLHALEAISQRCVLLVDTYELLAPLDAWLRDVFLPELPGHVLVVTAGRSPLPSAWHADPGWQKLVRNLPLQVFSLEESQTYLQLRRVGSDQHAAILDFAHGHPLALSLVADLFDQRSDFQFRPESAPDVIHALVEQFVQQVPSPAHHAALEACAMVRVINEALLAEMLSMPDVRVLFDWLRGLSFIESGLFGLFPHDLARDALASDLRWRNPDWYAELHRRARAYYTRRLVQTQGRDQQRVLSDYVFLHRDNPVFRPFLDWQEVGTTVPDPAEATDHEALCRIVERHEGEEAARLASYWLEHQPQGTLVIRGNDQHPVGLLMRIALEELTEQERNADPAINAACRYLASHAPLRAGERAAHFRFWMARETYQAVSPTQSLIFLKLAQFYLTTPQLAFTFFPCADETFWAPFCDYIELVRMPKADYEVGGRRYHVFGHDWRETPPLMWLDHLARREVSTDVGTASTPPAEPLVVLDKPAFTSAVREALRSYTRPDELRTNPLLRSRLVRRSTGVEADDVERIEALRTVLRESAEALQTTPREAKLNRALYRVYFNPAPSQEQAAEMLNVPFSTFRRHLKEGVLRLTERLWQLEISAQEKRTKNERKMSV